MAENEEIWDHMKEESTRKVIHIEMNRYKMKDKVKQNETLSFLYNNAAWIQSMRQLLFLLILSIMQSKKKNKFIRKERRGIKR